MDTALEGLPPAKYPNGALPIAATLYLALLNGPFDDAVAVSLE